MNCKINPAERVALLAAERTHILSGSLLFNYIAMLKEIKTLPLSVPRLRFLSFFTPEQFVIFPLCSPHSHPTVFVTMKSGCIDCSIFICFMADTAVRFDQCGGSDAFHFCVEALLYK